MHLCKKFWLWETLFISPGLNINLLLSYFNIILKLQVPESSPRVSFWPQ